MRLSRSTEQGFWGVRSGEPVVLGDQSQPQEDVKRSLTEREATGPVNTTLFRGGETAFFPSIGLTHHLDDNITLR